MENIKSLKKIKISRGDRRDLSWLGGGGGISLFIPLGKRPKTPKNRQILDFLPYIRARSY